MESSDATYVLFEGEYVLVNLQCVFSLMQLNEIALRTAQVIDKTGISSQ